MFREPIFSGLFKMQSHFKKYGKGPVRHRAGEGPDTRAWLYLRQQLLTKGRRILTTKKMSLLGIKELEFELSGVTLPA